MLWLLQRASAKLKIAERNAIPDIPIDWSTSYVRPSSDANGAGMTREEIAVWYQRQKEKGRYVISDSHFKIGGCVRSVPRLNEPAQSAVMQRTLAAERDQYYRSQLSLKNP
jgi:hypothetical protein